MNALSEVLSIFKKITAIPHCSGNTEELKNFIVSWAENFDYEVKSDKAGNILVSSKNPKICFQAHYDMVCVGKAPKIEIIEEEGWLKAKDSSLGADNGIGVAIMLYLISQRKQCEFLFTNDEEIGLIGAFNLDLKIKSPYLLNLDSEDGNIYIGCAGGVDCIIEYPQCYKKVYGTKAKTQISSLPGGHSGVDIDKNIPNAIVELLKKVNNISFIKGGERRNSIPSNAYCDEIFAGNEEFEVYCDEYINFLRNLPHGVLEYDFKYSVPSKSLNFAMIEGFKSVFSLRANSNEKLEEVKEYLKQKAKGAKIVFENQYPAWKPQESKFAILMKELTESEFKVIHAGLECAVLKEKFKDVQMLSYGPVIENPHSVRERVKIESVKVVLNVIDKLLKRI